MMTEPSFENPEPPKGGEVGLFLDDEDPIRDIRDQIAKLTFEETEELATYLGDQLQDF